MVTCVFLSAFLSVERSSLQAFIATLVSYVTKMRFSGWISPGSSFSPFYSAVMSANLEPAALPSTGYSFSRGQPTLLSGAPSSPIAWTDTNASICGSNYRQLFLYVRFSPGVGLNSSPVNTDSTQACNALKGRRPGQEQRGKDAACEFNL